MDISVDRGVELWGQVLTVLATYGLDVVGALVTLIIGWIIAGRVSALVRRGLGRLPRFDPTLTSFFGNLARYVVIAVTIIARPFFCPTSARCAHRLRADSPFDTKL